MTEEENKEYRRKRYQKHKEGLTKYRKEYYINKKEERKNIKTMIDILTKENILTPEQLRRAWD